MNRGFVKTSRKEEARVQQIYAMRQLMTTTFASRGYKYELLDATDDDLILLMDDDDHEGDRNDILRDDGPKREDDPVQSRMKLIAKLKLALLGAAVGMILLVGVLVLLGRLAANGDGGGERTRRSCPLSQTKPHLKRPLQSPRAVFLDRDAKLRAKLAGYIHVYGRGFLNLDLNRVTIIKRYGTISLEDQCAGITLTVTHDSSQRVKLDKLQWYFKSGETRVHNKIREHYIYCNMNEPEFSLTFSSKLARYSFFTKPQVFKCQKLTDNGKFYSPAELVIEFFELELGRDAELFRQGKSS